MRGRHLFAVLSPRAFGARTLLVIGLKMATVEYDADNPFARAGGVANHEFPALNFSSRREPECVYRRTQCSASSVEWFARF